MVIGLMLSVHLLFANDIDVVRKQFHEIKDEETLKAFLKMASAIEDNKVIPYKEAAAMRQAEFTANLFKKLKFFNAGKEQLETYIKSNPFDIEARYIRALIQHDVPAILNYNEHFETDVKYVLDNIDASELSNDYKRLMKETLTNLKNAPL
ncbi:hypothetical protein [uncultured Carboxylicivirga sp.]|nr:hypothetical protein [uncultured Carboxylicivirga sp.]